MLAAEIGAVTLAMPGAKLAADVLAAAGLPLLTEQVRVASCSRVVSADAALGAPVAALNRAPGDALRTDSGGGKSWMGSGRGPCGSLCHSWSCRAVPLCLRFHAKACSLHDCLISWLVDKDAGDSGSSIIRVRLDILWCRGAGTHYNKLFACLTLLLHQGERGTLPQLPCLLFKNGASALEWPIVPSAISR